MNKFLLIIFATVIFLPQLSFAEDEVIWESEKIPYLHDVIIAPQGDILYNINGKTLQIRRISDGKKIDSIVIQDVPNYLYHMSISSDGRYMAMTGDNPYVIIYDLLERKELKRITTVAYEREEYEKNIVYNAEEWISSSISPDGTKITGVVIHKDYDKTNFVVIDIETEKVLFEQRRITYDYFNPSPESFKWMSAEFSPDGNYIVAQLDYRIDGNNDASDSVYIYDAKTLKIYDVVLNNFINGNGGYNKISLSTFQHIFNFYSNNHIYTYNISKKTILETNMNPSVWSFVFSRKSNQVIYGFDWESQVYDLDSKEIIYRYQTLTKAEDISLDNTKLFTTLYDRLYCLKTFFGTETIVEIDESDKNVISPNPTTGILNINLQNQFPSVFNYSLISDSGQVILSKELGFLQPNSNNLNIDISNVPIGHYILRLFSEREEFKFNIIKEN